VKDISKIGDSKYYYCFNPECKIVYYNANKEQFDVNKVNKEIGFKDYSSYEGAICYCFNIPKARLLERNLLNLIKTRIDYYGDRCDLRHPAGICCMDEIKRTLKTIQVEGEKRLFEQKILEEEEEEPLITEEPSQTDEESQNLDGDEQDGVTAEESDDPRQSYESDGESGSGEHPSPRGEIEDLVTLENLPDEVMSDHQSLWLDEYSPSVPRVYLDDKIEDILIIVDDADEATQTQEETPQTEPNEPTS